MRRFAPAALVALLAVSSFAQQPQQPGPWSEQPPYAQGPQSQSPQGQYAQPGRYPQGPQAQGPGGPQPDTDGDAPDRGVARISVMNGNVSVRRGDSGDMVAGILNAPLTAGDRVVTADGSRAEVQFDSANLIRLGPAAEVRLSELQYGRFHVQIASGTTIYRVLRDSTADVEISTPSISVRPLKIGVYKVTVHPDGTSEITVRFGDAEVFGPRGSEQLHAGSTMMVRGAASDPEFQVVGAAQEDELDRWAASRDQMMEHAQAPRYVGRDVYGAEDLDQNGRWTNDPSYGNVWVPSVDPGWAPYRCGRWTWVDYYGWSWVGCESWGWAPYHYGRWFYGSYGWSWWPGGIYSRAYWRPALVGFFGWGGGVGVGVGFGFGNVGWVPLAPYERFNAWYGGGFRGTTVVNNVNVTNVYRNARVANGVTSVQAGQFGRGNVSNANFVHASTADLARTGAVRGQLPMTASAASRQFSARPATTQGLPRTSENTHFFSRGTTAGGASAQSSGGWQRFTPSTRGTAATGQGSGASRYSGSAQQQVRISPSMVQNRSSYSNGSARPTSSARPASSGGSRGTGSSSRGGSNGGHGGPR